MLPAVEQLNFFLSIGTLVMQGALVVLVIFLFTGGQKSLIGVIKQYALPLGFFAALFASALTLVYSDVFGFIPCSLCWLQRIFLYPQVVLLGIAWWKKDEGVWKKQKLISVSSGPAKQDWSLPEADQRRDRGTEVWDYIIALSILGLLVALYHHYLQMGGTEILPCPASGEGDCGKRFIYEFNYVTFPLMAATLFAWQWVLGLIAKR